MTLCRRLAAAVLAFVASAAAVACPICFRGMTLTTAQQLGAAERAVLARPQPDGKSLRVVAIVKGGASVGETITETLNTVALAPIPDEKVLLLLQHGGGRSAWLGAGLIRGDQADWLRKVASQTPDDAADAAQWREHVAFLLPYLESAEPMVADIAASELARAPYTAVRTLKPRLDAASLAKKIDDPSRRALYTLLLGIAGTEQDAERIEQRLDAAWKSGDATNLAALLAADLELRGPARVGWIERMYLAEKNRMLPEIEAALLALSVHGNAAGTVPRERVIQAYRLFMRERKTMAGFVAEDLAQWNYWDAGPEYVALLKSNALRNPASRYAVLGYLKQSPRAEEKAAVKALASEFR